MAKRRHVVITNTSRGVYFAEIDSDPNPQGQLQAYNVRHCFGWRAHPEAPGVWGLAIKGPQKGSQIGPTVKKMLLCNVASIADCEPLAVEAWLNARWET